MGLTVEETAQITDIGEDEITQEYIPSHQPEKGHGWGGALPKKQGLYDPELEKDACGVGFAAYVFELKAAVRASY